MKNASGLVGLVIVVVILIVFASYVGYSSGAPTWSTTSYTTTFPVMKGVVAGYVTVGPSQPVCKANESCTVDLTGYSLVFKSVCATTSSCQEETFLAPIGPNGHYSAFLDAGNYSVIGLSPSCTWMGCASAFPRSVVVESGMQLSFDVNIDTGIR